VSINTSEIFDAPFAKIDGPDAPPKMIDQTVDLFGDLFVDDAGDKVEQSSSFDDGGWANFQGNTHFIPGGYTKFRCIPYSMELTYCGCFN
jgi:hypothetical protein